MNVIVLLIHITVTILLSGCILFQNSKGGLGSAFGGEFYRTRRGAEKILFGATLVLTVIFFATSIANLMIR